MADEGEEEGAEDWCFWPEKREADVVESGREKGGEMLGLELQRRRDDGEDVV